MLTTFHMSARPEGFLDLDKILLTSHSGGVASSNLAVNMILCSMSLNTSLVYKVPSMFHVELDAAAGPDE